ncbi:MAG: lipoyl(octanoyl) transferase LipB [Myxococcales bacterium]|nr:lipoyl(octanoyl) transferase LipB [Myxococcales bacterium]
MARLIHLGRVGYRESWARQELELHAVIEGAENAVILCEHDPVYTLGRRRGAIANVIDPGDTPVIEVERGGDVTWHGPGQLVGYPIVRLDEGAPDLHAHLRRLEDVVIGLCADLGIAAGRDARNTGVWIGGRKVCSVGIAVRRWVTWHGLAINCDPDLSAFQRINPCGLDASVMTSLTMELCRPVAVAEVEPLLAARMADW